MIHVSHTWVGYAPKLDMLFDILGNVPQYPGVVITLYSGKVYCDRGEFIQAVGCESLRVGLNLMKTEHDTHHR